MGKQRVVHISQSPMNAKQWYLELACGHPVWLTASRRPTTKTALCTSVRTLVTDPDFRRTPKTADYCWYCNRDFKNGADVRETFVIDGAMILHPADVKHHAADYQAPGGWLPVGADCAARIGLEWTRARRGGGR